MNLSIRRISLGVAVAACILAVLLYLPDIIGFLSGHRSTVHSTIIAPSAHVRITSPARVLIVDTAPDSRVSMNTFAFVEVPAGATVTLEGGLTIGIGKEVTVGGRKYGGSKDNEEDILVLPDGQVIEDATLAAQ